jgi:hypothetical protein
MSIKNKYYVERIPFSDCKDWLLNKHYAKRIPSIIKYSFGLFNLDNKMIGISTFGIGANYNLNEIIKGCITYELSRLVVNDNHEKNVTSFFVSQCLKSIPDKKCIIVSYADSGQDHHGYIYQATNFLYTGLGCGDIEFLKDGIKYHRKKIYGQLGTGSVENAKRNGFDIVKVLPKHRYIYFIGTKKEKKEMRKALRYEIQPYPKGENKNYDASYQPEIQGKMF